MNFFKTPAVLKHLYPSLIWDKHAASSQAENKTIYLTFDDGPIPDLTSWVLKTLKSYQARGTFFCVGDNIRQHPDLYHQIVAEGHRTGNHTFHHLNGWKTENYTYLKNILQCEQLLCPSQNTVTKLFRPPYGKIKQKQIQQVAPRYDIIMWDILSGDFDPDFNHEACLDKCIQHTQTGTIIIFHDNYKAQKNLTYVLPRYLEHFSEQGYTFATL
uniref:Polysaccharide deacetylase family protein n=1 Tax=Roseihalotalea indica TaxID=2867963 RepID=A0AA49JJ20_9BACT|nr:polysaccharide deacetylase family protein [Tunicatimonas sp. TK19036]